MRKKVSLLKVTHPRYNFVVIYPDERTDGSTVLRKTYFHTRPEAASFQAEKKAAVSSHGARHAHVNDSERAALIRYRQWAKEMIASPSLLDLINEAISARERVRVTVTVKNLIDARLLQAERSKLSARHIADLMSRLRKFEEDFGSRMADSITPAELEEWLHGLGFSSQTFTNYKRIIGSVFSLAVNRGTLSTNPVSRIIAPKVNRKAPSILTPAQLQVLLEASDPGLRPLLVLQAFAGLRRAESERLAWRHIHLDAAQPYIELPSEITKTNRRRVNHIPSNAVAWLRPFRQLPNQPLGIGERAYDASLKRAARLARIKWEGNLLRHSFGSYRLPLLKNAEAVAEEMGNSPTVVRVHYTNLVSPHDVAAYWEVRPCPESNVIAIRERAAG